jgi:hypothetical protein
MSPSLSKVLKTARRSGLRPFEIFAEGKAWVDAWRLELRGVVAQLEAKAAEKAETREGEAQLGTPGLRRGRPPKPKAEDEAVGVGRDFRDTGHLRSHLLELRRAAIAKALRREAERTERAG